MKKWKQVLKKQNEDIFREDFGQTYDDMWRYVVGEEEEEEPRTFMGLKY